MRLLALCSCFLFGLLAPTEGDNPPADNWPKTVETLGAALTDSDPGMLLSVLGEDKSIFTFDGKGSDGMQLLSRTRKAQLIGSFNYTHAPETMASDMAEAVKNAEVPEEVKRRMAMRDEVHARKANRTAVTWLVETLGAKQGDRVGALIYWCERAPNGEPPEIVFVLVKADPDAQNKKIKAICFGSLSHQAK
jgi:hypothetical protein